MGDGRISVVVVIELAVVSFCDILTESMTVFSSDVAERLVSVVEGVEFLIVGLAFLPGLMGLLEEVLLLNSGSFLVSALQLVLELVAVVVSRLLVEVVLMVLVVVRGISVVQIAVLVAIVDIAVSVVLGSLDQLGMRRLDIHARVVLVFGLVMDGAHIV
mmetsp:Transcript_41215/g.54135  ORF Transcript_41215/g.54135 Transcript_41215/m.54135 type:complete len:159 (+) Transcript_41215:140-616(+)